jgi:hypothetical protein
MAFAPPITTAKTPARAQQKLPALNARLRDCATESEATHLAAKPSVERKRIAPSFSFARLAIAAPISPVVDAQSVGGQVAVGRSDDLLEREGDRTAEQALRRPAPQRGQGSRMPLAVPQILHARAREVFGSGGRRLQRKCACGGEKSAFGESCSDCEAGSLQRKLAVGSRHDAMEMEADAIAAKITGPRFKVSPAGPLPIAGSPSSLQVVGPAVPDSVNAEISRGGTMLEADLREEMESGFGYDFSQVRVHAGATAAQSAHDVNALAYTAGHDIVFGTNQFAPHTHEGRQLLAHELTHVVQQTRPNATTLVQRDVGKRADAPPSEANPQIVIFVADPKFANDVAFAKRLGKADAAQIRKRGIDAEDRQTLNAKLKFFSGDAWKVYGDLIRPALEEVLEIQMPAADMRIQSYVFAGDPHRKSSEVYARELARDLGARIRENPGSRPTAEQQLEFEATGKFFVGEARAVYVQETNEWREKRDPAISRFVKEGIEEIDGSARWRVLAGQVLAVSKYDPKKGLRQWAIEMKAVPHGRKGNYLLAFFEELVNDHFFEQLDESTNDAQYWRVARAVVHELDAQGVDVRELYLARTLSQLSAYEQSKYATVDINAYHIYDWKRAVGAPLEPIVEAINVILHFLPVIGEVLAAVEALLGRELLTGRKLAGWERLLGIAPYAGEILRAGKGTVGIVVDIARTSKMKPAAVLRLLQGASETAMEVDRLREIKRLVDTHSLLSAEQRNLLSSTISRFRPVEQEARAAGVIQEVEEASAKATTQAARDEEAASKAVVPVASAAKVHPPGTVLAKTGVSGGHSVQVMPEGIRLCSGPPCDFIADAYKGELTDVQREKLRLAEANRIANPEWAAEEAAEVREELEIEHELAKEEGAVADRRTVSQYQRDLRAAGLMDNPRVALIAQRQLAQRIEAVLPRTTSVTMVAAEGSEAVIAQGRAAARPGTIVNPEVEARIDLPDAIRKKAGLTVPGRGESRIPGSFKPDDIEIFKDKSYLFKDHKEVSKIWEESYYSSEAAQPKLRALLERDLGIAQALGPKCKGFAFTTNSRELANLLASEIGKLPKEARKYLHAPSL